jgi:hypothetical protein
MRCAALQKEGILSDGFDGTPLTRINLGLFLAFVWCVQGFWAFNAPI